MKVRYQLRTLLCVLIVIMGIAILWTSLYVEPQLRRARAEYERIKVYFYANGGIPDASIHRLMSQPYGHSLLKQLDREIEFLVVNSGLDWVAFKLRNPKVYNSGFVEIQRQKILVVSNQRAYCWCEYPFGLELRSLEPHVSGPIATFEVVDAGLLARSVSPWEFRWLDGEVYQARYNISFPESHDGVSISLFGPDTAITKITPD